MNGNDAVELEFMQDEAFAVARCPVQKCADGMCGAADCAVCHPECVADE